MAGPREECARRAARDLLDELGVCSYPIDVDGIAHAKRLTVEHREGFPSGVYGAMWRSGNQFGIVISNRCPTEGHRRFTLAHELGHYHIDGHVEQLLAGEDSQALSLAGHFRGRKDPVEVEADAFAAELLMPASFARSIVQHLQPAVASVRTLSDAFRVSLSCAAVRFAELTDEPLVVVLSHNGVIEWTARSPALWAHGGWARSSWRQEWVPRGSGTYRLTRDHAQTGRGAGDGSELLACEWFADAPSAVIATEDALGLGTYGRVLTMLTFSALPDPDESYLDEQRERDEAHRQQGDREPIRRGDWRHGLRDFSLDDDS